MFFSEFFGDDAFSFDKIEIDLTYVPSGEEECGNVDFETQFIIDIENLVGRKLSESELKMIPVLIERSIKDDVKIQRHVGEWIQNNIFNYITYQLDRELKKLETDL